MKHLILYFLIICCASTLNAQVSYMNDTSETAKLSESVTKKFFRKMFPEAIDELQKYWQADKSELGSLKELTESKMDLAIKRYGEFTSYERVKVSTINDLVREETYIIRMEYHVLRFKFLYYKSVKGWIVNNFTWDDKLSELLKE